MVNPYLNNLFQPYLSTYSKTEKKIAKYFLEIGADISVKTLEQLSTEIGVSKSAIFQFVKKHGFTGFQTFKIAIAQNLPVNKERTSELVVFSDISSTDSYFAMAQKIIQSSKALLDELLHSLNEEQLNKALDLILSSSHLHFFGLGSSSTVAYDSYHKFIRSKFLCNYIQDHHMQISYATKLDESNCIFLFSHSGNSIETINIAKVAKENKAKLIVLTGNAMSELLEYADVSFVIDTVEASLGSESLSSRSLYLTVIDILYTAVMYDDEENNKNSVAKIRKALLHSKK